MKRIAGSLFIFLGVIFYVRAQETAHVISHNQEIIVTDPGKGSNSYKTMVEFPYALCRLGLCLPQTQTRYFYLRFILFAQTTIQLKGNH